MFFGNIGNLLRPVKFSGGNLGFNRSFIILLCSLLLSSCSVLGTSTWGSYRVTLEFHDIFGERLEGVNAQSLAVKSDVSGSQGQSTLYFSQSGLHIVTLLSSNTITKQIKIKIPSDVDSIVVVNLEHK